MPSCAFLTLGETTLDDRRIFAPLSARDWQVVDVHWREARDWRRFDRVVIRCRRNFWRRSNDVEQRVRLDNSLSLVRWNMRKRYLEELAGQGIATVPTDWRDALEPAALRRLLALGGHAQTIVKPVISASAERTYRIGPSTPPARLAAI